MRLGFEFVPLPREIWTDGIELSQAEFRLLGWFCSDLRFGICQGEFSDELILKGGVEGARTYPPVGLSRNSMQAARNQLVEKQLLIAEKITDGGGRGKSVVWQYKLNLSESEKNPETSQTLTNNLSNSERFTPLNLSNSERFEPVISCTRDKTKRKADRTRDGEEAIQTLLEGVEVKPKFPEWLPMDLWDAFVEMRKKLKAPLTEKAVELAVMELGKLRLQGHEPRAVLEQSILHSWKGLFPVKDGFNGGRQTRSDERQQRNRKIITEYS